MKRSRSGLLVAAGFLAVVGRAAGEVLGYDPTQSERPDQADPAWVMSGTTDPINAFYGGGTIAGVNVSGTDKGAWYYSGAGLSDAGYTVDFRVLVDSDPSSGYYPIEIFLYDSGELVLLKLGKQEGVGVEQEGGGLRASNAGVVTDDVYHTYRYARAGQEFTMYQDAALAPVLSGSLLNNNVLPGYDRVFFGRGDSVSSGTSGWDYLLWNNAQAILGPPDTHPLRPAPAPTPAALIGMAFAGWAAGQLGRSRRPPAA